jgi:hypothetical protein
MPQSVLPRGFGSALSYRATRFRCLLTLEQGGVERVPVDELVEDLSEVSFVFLQHLLRLEQRVRELAPRIAEKNRSGPRRHWDRRCLVSLGLHACQRTRRDHRFASRRSQASFSAKSIALRCVYLCKILISLWPEIAATSATLRPFSNNREIASWRKS